MNISRLPRKREILIHFPLPYYSSDQLVRTLTTYDAFHRKNGICIPDPNAYQKMVTHCIRDAPTETNLKLMRSALQNSFHSDATRMFLSFPGLPNSHSEIFGKEGILPNLSQCVGRINRIFPEYSLTLLFGVVNQGHLLASLIQSELVGKDTLDRAIEAQSLYWVDAVGACADEYQNLKFVVWKHEDAAFLWPDIIRLLGNIPSSRAAPGCLDMLIQKLSEEGIKVLRELLKGSKPISSEGIADIIKYFTESRRYRRKMNTTIRLRWWTKKISNHFESLYLDDEIEMKGDTKIQFLFQDQKRSSIEEKRYA